MRMAMLVIACGLLVVFVSADEGSEVELRKVPATQVNEKAEEPAKSPQQPINSDEPMSIFNEEIRQFKFKIEDTLVTNEVAQAFAAAYDHPDNPKIFGAYPDTDSNSLVVIAPPEAESAIRQSLATRYAELMDYGNPSLEVQKRVLQNQRNVELSSLAGVELSLVEAEWGKNEEQVKLLKARLEALESELELTERKLQVVNKYLKRLNEDRE